MKERIDCRGCKHLTRTEHWTARGRGTAAYCLYHRKVVRIIRGCDAKDEELDKKIALDEKSQRRFISLSDELRSVANDIYRQARTKNVFTNDYERWLKIEAILNE